ncbi:MAG: hypothetical protein IKG93_05040 [Clostridiales bacterium]|nr:hypothetical protein [Clostridiales bacterium]
MTLIKKHTCTNCGGPLIIHNDRQQYECPYCNVFFDYEYFRSRDILEQAASSQKMLQYDSAKEKYEFILNKEPHNFLALRGKLLCEVKLNRPEELKKPENVLLISPDALLQAEEACSPEGKTYFSKLRLLYELAGYIRVNDRERECIEKGRIQDTDNPYASIRIDGVEKSHLLVKNREKRQKFDEEFSKLYSQLEALNPKEIKADRSPKDTSSVINFVTSASCPSCSSELIVNLDRQLYECPYCGVTYDFDFIRDETALAEAEEALSESQFIKADSMYSYILAIDPKNFEALRGRILCAAKWTDLKIALQSAELYMRKAHIPTIKTRIEEAIGACEESDRPYFEEFLEIIPAYEEFVKQSSPSNESRRNKNRLVNEKNTMNTEYNQMAKELAKLRQRLLSDTNPLSPDEIGRMGVLSRDMREIKKSRRFLDECINEKSNIVIQLNHISEKAMESIKRNIKNLVSFESEKYQKEGTAE